MEKLDFQKGIIYYTDNTLDEHIEMVVQRFLIDTGLPIVSASLAPINFGVNVVVEGKRSYPTMVKQIIAALELQVSKYVFFCEHDVLYPLSHFDFTPPRDDVFYYNENVWRWLYGSDTAIRHDRMLSLSGLCVNRELALQHYKMREAFIKEKGYDKITGGEPDWARKMGYEPAQKKKKRGGLTDDEFQTWSSPDALVDIRHSGTFSPPKTKLSNFKHPPKWWKEVPIEEVKSFNLRGIYGA